MATIPTLSPSAIPADQAVHVVVFGLLFGLLASPKTINWVQKMVPSAHLSESGTQLTNLGLLVHAVLFMVLALAFAYYQLRSSMAVLR